MQESTKHDDKFIDDYASDSEESTGSYSSSVIATDEDEVYSSDDDGAEEADGAQEVLDSDEDPILHVADSPIVKILPVKRKKPTAVRKAKQSAVARKSEVIEIDGNDDETTLVSPVQRKKPIAAKKVKLLKVVKELKSAQIQRGKVIAAEVIAEKKAAKPVKKAPESSSKPLKKQKVDKPKEISKAKKRTGKKVAVAKTETPSTTTPQLAQAQGTLWDIVSDSKDGTYPEPITFLAKGQKEHFTIKVKGVIVACTLGPHGNYKELRKIKTISSALAVCRQSVAIKLDPSYVPGMREQLGIMADAAGEAIDASDELIPGLSQFLPAALSEDGILRMNNKLGIISTF
jgi:uncharacterized protein (DUF2147 family)